MSKEMEALNELSHRLASVDTSKTIEEAHYDVFPIIRKSLTPPTTDEVCEALSGWFDENFYYDVNQKVFYPMDLKGQHSVVKMKKNEIHFGVWYTMPPHLITLIGRFYEGLEELK